MKICRVYEYVREKTNLSAYWMTYKPFSKSSAAGWPEENLEKLLLKYRSDPTEATEWWRCLKKSVPQVGDRVFFFKQGSDPRGIFGFGRVFEGVKYTTDSFGTDGRKNRVHVRFEKLVDPRTDFIVHLSDLKKLPIDSFIISQQCGRQLSSDLAFKIEALFPKT